MSDSKKLLKRTCFNHEARESVAQCKICGQTFCRECISLIDNKMTCSGCVSGNVNEEATIKKDHSLLILCTLVITGSISGFFLFYLLARFLTNLPDNFHDGSYF